MSESATPVEDRPAFWAQALFAGSVLLAGLSIWLLATV